jgi:predicted secreted protein
MKVRSQTRTVVLCTLLSAFFLQLAHRSQAQTPVRKVVQIGEIGEKAHVSLNVGDTLRVVLQANITTGYGWQVATNNAALLKAGTVTNMAADSKKIGAPGRQEIVFTAIAQGADRLVLAYRRPWEKKAAPARTLALEVEISSAGTQVDPALAVQPEGVLFARYAGKLPCADCSGIQETLSLYAPGPNNFVNAYYVAALTYLGRESIYVSAGTWYVMKGTSTEPDATVYALSQGSSERDQNYQRQGDTLVPLDDKLNLIGSPSSAALKRVQ